MFQAYKCLFVLFVFSQISFCVCFLQNDDSWCFFKEDKLVFSNKTSDNDQFLVIFAYERKMFLKNEM